MSSESRERWDAMRCELLVELADVVATCEHYPEQLESFIDACTSAYDRPVPTYTVYNRLRSFKAGAWPLLCRLIESNRPEHIATGDLLNVLESATALLRETRSLHDGVQADALEVQLAVLQKLLGELSP